MADIFISYKRGGDEEIVAAMVGGLRANGLSVWWDRDIPAQAPWEETILAELQGAKLAIVCWSKDAVDSENVRSEARFAKEHDKLLQVFVAPCQPPLFFGENQGLKLEEVADVYGARFAALLDAVRQRLGAQAAPAPRPRNDPAVRAWRRNEPAAPWEALQFGLSFSFVTVAVWLVWLWLATVLPFERLVGMASGIGFAGVGSAIAGWLSYAWLARRPRRIGLLRGTLLAALTGLLWGAGVLFYDALARAIVSTMSYMQAARAGGGDQRSVVPGWEVEAGMAAIGAFIGGALLARIWLPLFVVWLRRPLRIAPIRLGVAGLAALAPAFAAWAMLQPPADSAELRRVSYWTAWGMARAGFETLEEARARALDPLGRPAPSAVARLEQTLGRKIRSGVDAEGLWLDLKEKTEWTLAADGSGDGRTMQEILARSAGPIRIFVKAGVYGPQPNWSDAGEDAADGPLPLDRDHWPKAGDWELGPLAAAAYAMMRARTHRIELIGERGVVFEENRALTIPAGMTVSDADINLPTTLSVETGAALRRVRIQVRGAPERTGVVLLPAPDRPRVMLRSAYDDGLRAEPPPPRAILEGFILNVLDQPLQRDIVVEEGAAVRMLAGRVHGFAPTNVCLRVDAARDVTVRDVDLSECARGAVAEVAVPNANLFRDVAGMVGAGEFRGGASRDVLRY